MRWVTILAAGYALSQVLAYADPARTPGLASPAPWRPPGTRTAGLIRAGLARLLRGVGPSALTPAIARKSDRRTDRHIGRRTPAGAVAEVVESGGGVVSGLSQRARPAFERRRRPRHGAG
jgi:hypothetical protein